MVEEKERKEEEERPSQETFSAGRKGRREAQLIALSILGVYQECLRFHLKNVAPCFPPGRREEESWWNQDENEKKIESKHESIIDRSNLIPLSRPSCPYPPNRFRDRLFFIAFAARRLICCSSADHVSGKSTVAASKSLVIFFDEAFEHPPTLAESGNLTFETDLDKDIFNFFFIDILL